MNPNENVQDSQQPGLVPSYPFPALVSSSNRSLGIKQTSNLLPYGSFLPPIFGSYFDASFIEEMAPIESDRILTELIAEEVSLFASWLA